MAVNKDKNIQFLLTVPKDLSKEIDRHQEQGQFMNRNEAVRDLIKKGLEKENAE